MRNTRFGNVDQMAKPRRTRVHRPSAENPVDRHQTVFGGVHWTPIFVAFLVYVFVVVTYRIPLATAAMVVATAALFMTGSRIRFPSFLVFLGAFVLWGAAGYPGSEYPTNVWAEVVLFGKLWLIALVAVNALRTPGQLRFFMIFFVFMFATHPARGTIYNYVFGFTEFGRAAWNYIYANPNDMAALSILPLAVSATLLKDGNKWVRWGAIASIVVLPIVILLTQSRGGFIALTLFAVLAWLGQRKRARNLALLCVLAGGIAIAAPTGMWERVSALSEEGTEADSSSRQRWAIWHATWDVIHDNPVRGVGLGSYERVHFEFTLGSIEHAGAAGNKDPHSTYLRIWAEAGYLGLILFLGTLAVIILHVERTRRRLKRESPEDAVRLWYLEAGLFAFLTAGLFGSYGHLSFLYLHLALLYSFSEMPRHPSPPVRRTQPRFRSSVPQAIRR